MATDPQGELVPAFREATGREPHATCGDDADAVVEAVRPYVEAGFDRVALVQIGPEQEDFRGFWSRELRDRLVGEFGHVGQPVAAGRPRLTRPPPQRVARPPSARWPR